MNFKLVQKHWSEWLFIFIYGTTDSQYLHLVSCIWKDFMKWIKNMHMENVIIIYPAKKIRVG